MYTHTHAHTQSSAPFNGKGNVHYTTFFHLKYLEDHSIALLTIPSLFYLLYKSIPWKFHLYLRVKKTLDNDIYYVLLFT